jgi:hypothetical protein
LPWLSRSYCIISVCAFSGCFRFYSYNLFKPDTVPHWIALSSLPSTEPNVTTSPPPDFETSGPTAVLLPQRSSLSSFEIAVMFLLRLFSRLRYRDPLFACIVLCILVLPVPSLSHTPRSIFSTADPTSTNCICTHPIITIIAASHKSLTSPLMSMSVFLIMPTSRHPSLRHATDMNASRSRLHVHFSQSCTITLTYQSALHHVISML